VTETRDDYEETWGKVVGLPYDRAQTITRNPDKSEVLECGGFFLLLFTKHYPKAMPPVIVLVMASQRPPLKESIIIGAVGVYTDLVVNILDLEPSGLLRLIAERFGCDIEIGKQRKKLYLCETVPTVPDEPVVRRTRPIVHCSPGELGQLGDFIVGLTVLIGCVLVACVSAST
jgi:hypothetical protein